MTKATNHLKHDFMVVLGPIYISESGHLHRHPAETQGYRRGRTARHMVQRGIFLQEYAPGSELRNDIEAIVAEFGAQVLKLRWRHYFRIREEDGTIRLHRHNRQGTYTPVGDNCIVVHHPDPVVQAKLEKTASGKKGLFKRVRQAISRVKVVHEIRQIARKFGVKSNKDVIVIYKGRHIYSQDLNDDGLTPEDLKMILSRTKDKLRKREKSQEKRKAKKKEE